MTILKRFDAFLLAIVVAIFSAGCIAEESNPLRLAVPADGERLGGSADIQLAKAAQTVFDPFGKDRLPEFYTGPVSALLGVNIHFVRPRTELLDMAKMAGLRFVRMDLFWQPVETRAGRYDFLEYDLLMRALEERGLGALFILDYGNPLYYDGPGRFSDKWGRTRTRRGRPTPVSPLPRPGITRTSG